MEQMVLYKGFRIRAYQDWSGQWLAETKRPIPLRPGVDADTDAEYIATPSAHLTPEAAVNVIKQMIDSPSTRGQKRFNSAAPAHPRNRYTQAPARVVAHDKAGVLFFDRPRRRGERRAGHKG